MANILVTKVHNFVRSCKYGKMEIKIFYFHLSLFRVLVSVPYYNSQVTYIYVSFMYFIYNYMTDSSNACF